MKPHADEPPRSSTRDERCRRTMYMPTPRLPMASPRKPAVSQRCRRTSRQPSARSRAEALGGRPRVRRDAHRRDEDDAEEEAPASIAKTQPAPATATMHAGDAGPNTFACAPRDGDEGVRLLEQSGAHGLRDERRRGGVEESAAAPAMPWSSASCQTCAVPVKRRIAVTLCVPRRTRSAAIITARRGRRSAQTPPASVTAAPPANSREDDADPVAPPSSRGRPPR